MCCLQNNPVFSSVTISHIYIYLLTLNKKRKLKIMGRVARLILLVVVSVCVVFCVLCCLQNNPVFSSVTLFHILKNENYELCILAGLFVDQITTGKNFDRKKRYSPLAVGWNKSQITICRVKIQTPTITGKNYDQKKRYSRLAYTICNTCNIL